MTESDPLPCAPTARASTPAVPISLSAAEIVASAERRKCRVVASAGPVPRLCTVAVSVKDVPVQGAGSSTASDGTRSGWPAPVMPLPEGDQPPAPSALRARTCTA